MGLFLNTLVFFILTDGIYSIMEDPKYQEIFKKFKEGIFPYVIKPDVLKKLPYVGDIELLDEFHVNNHTGKIYPLFVVRVNKNTLNSHYHSMITQRNLQIQILNVVKDSLDKFYPTGEFNLLPPNVEIIKV